MSEEKRLLGLWVTDLQFDAIRAFFGHSDWDFDPVTVSETQGVTEDNTPLTIGTQDLDSVTTDIDDQLDEPLNNDNGHAGSGGACAMAPAPIYPQHEAGQYECPHCLCGPCVTNDGNRQLWWPERRAGPRESNSGKRKLLYKKFWLMLMRRGAFNDPRYIDRKERALAQDPHYRDYVWVGDSHRTIAHRRDIMPNCVLQLVREWYPNPPKIPYMGHMWD